MRFNFDRKQFLAVLAGVALSQIVGPRSDQWRTLIDCIVLAELISRVIVLRDPK
jgi:hypothetical protein